MRIGFPAIGNIWQRIGPYSRRLWPHTLIVAFYVACEATLHCLDLDHMTWHAMICEGITVLYAYYVLLAISRNNWLKYLSAALPVLTLYIISDYYCSAFGAAFKLTGVRQVPELFQVANLNTGILLISVLGLVPLCVLLSIDFRNRRRLLFGLVAGIAAYSAVEVWPSAYLDLFGRFSGPTCSWSDMQSISDHGRLSMLLYWEAQRSRTLQQLRSAKDMGRRSDNTLVFRNLFNDASRKRNVHIIVLEGFFDPSRLNGIRLSRPAMHPRLVKIFGGAPGVSRSPVFGGHTAQAEFEVLTGVPAFAEYGEVEFNLFDGAQTDSLPKLLHGIGYRTYATNAFKPEFFNEDLAYRGLGFDKICFPKAYSKDQDSYLDSELPKKELEYIFDGDLLSKNLDFFARNREKSPGVPVFNYVLGVYGHYPYKIDYAKRPKVITAKVPAGFDRDLIEMLVNQLYYRSEALARFLEKLMSIDPEAVIVVVGDHLPYLEPVGLKAMGYKAYGRLGYLGKKDEDSSRYPALMVLDAGRPVRLHNFRHHYLPELILDLLTSGEYSKYRKCYQPMQYYHDRYTEVMRRAVQ